MKAKKRGKRSGLRARSKNARKAAAYRFTNDPKPNGDVKIGAGGSKSVQKRLKAQKAPEYVTEMIRLPQHMADYVMEVAEIAEVPPSLVIAVLAANSIFHGRRAPTEERQELSTLREQMEGVLAEMFHARGKLAQCRQIMEANDPGNAEMIFGAPVDTAKAEGESPQAQPAEAPSMDHGAAPDYPDEGVMP